MSLAEAMVVAACAAYCDHAGVGCERRALVSMLAAAHAVLKKCTHISRGPLSPPKLHCSDPDNSSRIIAEFRTLKLPERASILLREVEGFSYEESAEILGVTIHHAQLSHVAARLKLGRALTTLERPVR